jgi:hypothetical protein
MKKRIGSISLGQNFTVPLPFVEKRPQIGSDRSKTGKNPCHADGLVKMGGWDDADPDGLSAAWPPGARRPRHRLDWLRQDSRLGALVPS